MKTIKATYHTLGCKLNFAETAQIQKNLAERGIMKAEMDEIPDICIVNTCSVTAVADKKGKHLIRNLSRRFPEASIIVTGCMAQLRPEEVAQLNGVELVLGSAEKALLPDYVEKWLAKREKIIKVGKLTPGVKFHAVCDKGDRTRFFLKVQDGCNYFCSYCTIPFARGLSRSGNIDELVQLARNAANEGGKEIVITGVNVGEFGQDHGETFFELIKRLDEVEGIERFRISSIEPNLLTEEIIRWVAFDSRAFMPHFHIPLQSGSDKVLALMRRRYDTSLFASRIEIIRDLLPDAFIGVDIIAGARGETVEEWEKSLKFAESLDISRFHVFPYSERPGTRALSLGDAVSQEEKHRRVGVLSEISDRKLAGFIQKNIGTTRNVLWESQLRNGRMQGLTDNYIRIEQPLHTNLLNTITPVEISEENIVLHE